MAAIDYSSILDLEGTLDAFKKVTQANREFAKESIDLNKQIKASYDDTIKTLKTIQNAAKGSSGGALKGLIAETDRAVESARKHKEIMDSLNGSVDMNQKSINELRNILSALKKEYDNLKPTEADFAQKQKEIAEYSKAATAAMNAQTTVLVQAKKQAGETATSYRELNRQTGEMKNQLRQMPNAFDLTTGAINKNNAAAVQLQRQIERNDKALKAMDATMGNHQRNVGNYSSGLNGLVGNIKTGIGGVLGITSAFQALSETLGAMDRMERLNIALENASGSSKKFAENQKMIVGLANTTGTNIESMSKSYVKFTAATQGSNLEGAKANSIFSTFTKTFAALGASSVTAERGLLAVEQMISKNTVGAEELRQQLGDALPGSVRLFTEAYKELHNMSDLTTGQFMDLMKKGKVITEDILPIVAKQLEEMYGSKAQRNLQTMTGAWANMTNQFKLLAVVVNELLGLTRLLANTMNRIAQSAKDLASGRIGDAMMGIPGMPTVWSDGKTKDVAIEIFTQSSIDKQSKSISKIVGQIDELTKKRDALSNIPSNRGTYYDELGRANEIAEINKQLEERNELLTKYQKIMSKEAFEHSNQVYADAYDAKYGPKKKTGDTDSKLKRTTSEFEKLLVRVDNLRDVLVDQIAKNIDKGLEVKPETRKSWDELYGRLEKIAEMTGEELPKKLRDLNEKLNPSLKNVLDDPANFIYGRPQSVDRVAPDRVEDPSSMPEVRVSHLPIAERNYNMAMENLDKRFDVGRFRRISDKYKSQMQVVLAEILELEKKHGVDSNNETLRQARAKLQIIEESGREEIRTRKMITDAAIKLGTETVTALFEISKNFRESEMEAVQQQMNYDLEMAGDNENKKVEIRRSADRKMRELRREQAKMDKAQAIFSIALSTAGAVMNALNTPPAPVGMALAVIAGAIGAVQLATVIAKPLPAFFKGTDNAPEGYATIAEKGSEIRESKGRMYLYDKPQVTYLEKGDRVYTAQQTSEMLAKAYLGQEYKNDALQRSITGRKTVDAVHGFVNMSVINNNIDYDRLAASFGRELDNRPVREVHFTEKGVSEFYRTKNSRTQYLNKKMP